MASPTGYMATSSPNKKVQQSRTAETGMIAQAAPRRCEVRGSAKLGGAFIPLDFDSSGLTEGQW